MAVDVQIEGTSYLSGTPGRYTVDLSSVNIDLDIAVQQPRATFDVVVWDKAISRPSGQNEVVFYNADGDREFGGIIRQVEEKEMSPTAMKYTCTCSDYTPWLDRHLVKGTFNEQTADALIRSLVETYVNTPGNTRTFTTNNVQPSYVLPLMQFVYMPVSQVISQLQEMTGWGWFIDSYRDIHFYDTQMFQSPLSNNTLDADDLYNSPDLTQQNYGNWVDLSISEDTSQLKNRVYITGIYIASTQLFEEDHLGDGTTSIFVLGYQPPNDISKINVWVGGVEYQVGLDLVNSTPGGSCTDNVAYVNFTQQTVRFCTPPANGAKIIVKYYPMLQTATMEENAAAQAYIAARDGTDGVYEYNRMDPSLSAELPTLAQQRAYVTLSKYAYPYLSMTFTSYLQGWYPGQYFYFSSGRRFDGAYSKANGTQKSFFVTRVQKKIIKAVGGVWTWQYQVTAASIPFEI
ncbi:MAG: hypothetical protein KGL39_35155 [Patescibacteria group bacterium]|nr:hypothetical protein [Patescibacteria group bacterium]